MSDQVAKTGWVKKAIGVVVALAVCTSLAGKNRDVTVEREKRMKLEAAVQLSAKAWHVARVDHEVTCSWNEYVTHGPEPELRKITIYFSHKLYEEEKSVVVDSSLMILEKYSRIRPGDILRFGINWSAEGELKGDSGFSELELKRVEPCQDADRNRYEWPAYKWPSDKWRGRG